MVYTKSFPRNPENAVRIIQKPELLMQHAMPIFSDPLFSYNNLSCTHLLEKLCLKDFLSSLINNKTVPLDKLQEGNCDFFFWLCCLQERWQVCSDRNMEIFKSFLYILLLYLLILSDSFSQINIPHTT